MSMFVVDVEADGPIPGDFSMLSFGAVRVTLDGPPTTFESGAIKTISTNFNVEAIASIGLTPEKRTHLHANNGWEPAYVMTEFDRWITRSNEGGRPIFVSDNNGFDWMFVCWYFHHFIGSNPFGFSSRRIGDLYCGLMKDMRAPWKHIRKTKHTHNPVDDAMGNAEAIVHMIKNMGLKT